jgi:hypothetical protein
MPESTNAGPMKTGPAAQRLEQPSKYFFRRRRPTLRGVPREWVRPASDAEYARLLEKEGVISISLLKQPASAALKADCRELDEHLMPHFWRIDQRAKFFQNRFYLYQWIFILSAFLTTGLAATSVLIHTSKADLSVGPVTLTSIIGVFTALISGIAATVSFLIANESPQQRWFQARSQSENLRSLYFLFLARVTPFNQVDSRDRVQQLRTKVLDVLKDTGRQGNSQ